MARLLSGGQGIARSTLDRLLSIGLVRQRVVPDTANSFHVVAANGRGTAFAHHFVRNIGGSDPTDTGAPYQPWRYVGTAEIASVDTAPTDAARFVYSEDIGAQDFALQFAGNGLFAGSYHGGAVLTGESVTLDGIAIDPALPGTGSQFALRHTATVTSGGNAYTMEFTVAVRSTDGGLAFHCAAVSSAATFSRVFVGMVIGTGAYDEAAFTLQGGGSAIAVPMPVGTTYLGSSRAVALRRTADGRAIRVTTNMPQSATFRRAKIVRTSTRTKLYFESGTGALGTRTNLVWTVGFERGDPGAATIGANLIANPGFAADLSGWTVTQGSVAWNAGAARFTRSAGGDARMIQAIPTPSSDGYYGVYLLSGEEVSTPVAAQGAALIGLTSNVNGSTSSPAPAYPPVQNESGYTGHVVVPTQPISYVMAMQTLGTAGQTSDFDNLRLIKLSDLP